MKRGSRILVLLIIVIVILIVVAFLLRGTLFPGGATVTQTVSPMVNIITAGQNINRDDKIQAESLGTITLSQEFVTAGMVTDPAQIVGKYAVYPIKQGIPLTLDMISDTPGLVQPGSDAAKVVSPGLVAISIPITRLSSVAYGIKDGDRVDVITTAMFIDVDSNFQSKLPNLTAKVTGPGFLPDTLPVLSASIQSGGPGSEQGRAELDPTINQAIYLIPSESQRARLVTQMILQDIQVLHIGDFGITVPVTSAPVAEPAAAAGEPTATPQPQKMPDLVTVIVPPQDAVALTYLMYSGAKFTLALRAPDDTTRVDTEAATLQYLLSQYAIPVPAKLPYVMDNSSLPYIKQTPEPNESTPVP